VVLRVAVAEAMCRTPAGSKVKGFSRVQDLGLEV